MRWQYFEPGNADESLERERILRAISDWWKAFAAHADDIDGCFSRGIGFDVVGFMHQYLSPVSDDLCWEFGPALHQAGHRLIFTSESNKYLRPLIAQILLGVPSLPRWEFYEYRLPENIELAVSSVKQRGAVDPGNFEFRPSVGRYQRIDLEFVSPPGTGLDAKVVRTSGFLVVERLLGEELLDKWIGAIDGRIVDPAATQEVRSYPLPRLRETIVSTIKSILDQLPNEPTHRLTRTNSGGEKPVGAVLKMPRPKEQDDYPRWTDLLVASTHRLDLWRAAHQCPAFYSERFTRCGETFCYLKIDGREGLDVDKFADRAEIEEAIDAALVGADCGCVTAGGTGLIYSYIDLALADVHKGIQLIRQVLRAGNISKRSWLMFFENGLEHEWLGIWEDTPAPPIE